MAQKTAQLDIKVTGAQTLGQIEEELNQINAELKDVDKNSKAFKDLSKQAQKAKFALDEVNNSIEGVTNVKRAEGAKKLGEGLVGGFAAATSAAALFGDESSEALQKATQKAVLMFTALDGLEKVSKAFSKEATDGLKSLVNGFTKSIKSVRLFGLSSAASLALATAGITILIAGVIALVANFDKVTAWFNDLRDSIPFIDAIALGFEKLWEWIQLIDNVWDALVGGFKTLNDDSKTFAEGFKEALEVSLEIEESLERLDKLRKEGLKDSERAIKILESQKGTEEEIFKIKRADLKLEIQLLKAAGELSKEEKERLKDAQTELIVLENREKTRNQELATAKAQARLAAAEAKLAKDRNEAERREAVEAFRDKVFQERQLAALKQTLTDREIENIDSVNQFLDGTNRILREQIRILTDINNPLTERQIIENDLEEIYNSQFLSITKITAAEQELEDLLTGVLLIQKDSNDFRLLEAQLRQEILDLGNKDLELTKDELIVRERLARLLANEETTKREARIQKELEFQANVKHAELVQSKFIPLLRETNQLIADEYQDWLNNADAIELMDERLRQAALAISLLGDAAAIGFEAMLVGLDNQLLKLDKDLSKIQKRQSDFNDEEIDYQALLKDANGEKFEEIQMQMIAQEDLRKDLAQQEKDTLNEIAKAENEQAKIQKKQAVVDAIIQTLLAVVSALPNIPLSIAVGILGAATTATIAAKKIPLQDTYSEGGYTPTGKDSDAFNATLHGNEYVVPAKVLGSDLGGEMVSILEGMRTGIQSFADGGVTGNVPLQKTPQTQGLNGFNERPIWVSVKEIESVGNQVRVLETKSSL